LEEHLYFWFPFDGKSWGNKVANDNDDGPAGAEPKSLKPALIAELTWAKLYTKTMHQDLVAIATAITRNRPSTFGPAMKKNAEQLHDQLQDANRTVDLLSDQAGIRLLPVKKWRRARADSPKTFLILNCVSVASQSATARFDVEKNLCLRSVRGSRAGLPMSWKHCARQLDSD
jgi:hypothetical protein